MNALIYWLLLAVAAAYAFRRGGPPERIGMAAWIVASALTLIIWLAGLGSFETVQYGAVIADLLLLAIFVLLALKADRWWPLWATGFHLLGLATHLAKILQPDLHPWAYYFGQAIGGYAIMAAIVMGTIFHRRRIRTHGADRSWSASSIRSPRDRPRGSRAS